jgi:hypothetical protein
MYVIKKDKNDIVIINEYDQTFRLMTEEEKEVILEIIPQLNAPETDSVRVDKLTDGLKVVIRKELVQ